MRKTGTGLIAVCLTLCLYMAAQVRADTSLVLYFDFEGGKGDIVEDRSDYGNDGTIQGEARWVEGRFGEGLEIDLSSIVIVPDCDEFRITDKITLACWAKFMAYAPEVWEGNSYDFLVCRWNWTGGDNRCYETYLVSHAPGVVVSSDGTDAGGHKTAAAETAELDRWYNIVGVFDGSKVRIYVDGEEEGSEDYDGKILAGEGPISIGDNDVGLAPNFHFVGVIDEVAVYNRALSQSEIRQKMTSGHTAVESEGKLTTTWGEIRIQH
jgi:hypothetical protein